MLTSIEWTRNDFSRIPYKLLHRPDALEAERERIFRGPIWLFLGLEAEIPQPGDFRATYAGDIPVICNRGRDGQIYAFVNRCAHRGATVQRELAGNAKAHVCIYHRWGYNHQGHLIGVPFHKGVNGEGGLAADFDRQCHSLPSLRVAVLNGVIFGTLNPEAEPLRDYLGEMIVAHIQRLFHKPIRILGYQRQQIQANWKSYVENVKDTYHAGLLHSFLSTFGIDRATQKRAGRGNLNTA